MTEEFLYDTEARKGRWRDEAAEAAGLYTAYHFTGEGIHGLEVAYATAEQQPNRTTVRDVWKQRHGRAAAPLMVVVGYPRTKPSRALVCGPAGENPPVLDVDHSHAERLADAALREPNRHHAIRFLAGALDGDPEQLPGLRNKGLLATHELERGVPQRPDWPDAVERSQPLLGRRNHDLVRGLGYEIVQQGEHSILETTDGGAKRAVAVFLQASEQPDEPSARHGGQTPVTYALAQAEREGLTWVLAVRGGSIRLYSTTTSGAAGQRGRAETYVELALPLLPSERAGYLDLLFSSRALAPGGTIEEIQRASSDYTARLSERLRERVYNQVVPRLAVAVARQRGGTSEDDLDRHYRTSLTILFRLLFIAYAEDSRLLPLHVNGDYTRNALKSIARDIADRINAGGDLGFDNPLTPEVEPATDAAHTDLWDRCQELFTAVDKGHNRWGIPPYNGGLFSSDADINPVGPIIADLELSNGDFGPALAALLADRTPDGDVGPIDFRSLSVREFGTIYEGLLESELSVADQPLTIDSDGTYLPAGEDHNVVVEAGDVYLHDRSGARKSTGSYFTKPFAVEHLIDHAVELTLTEHLDRVREALDADRPADAADLIFDFRVADIAMGSGHFLTAVVDRLEARYTEFLTQHPIPQITAELDKLRGAAEKALGDLAETIEIENSSLLRRLIARRCVYGVDMNPISVELARVAMWIHTFVPGLPLSFLDHNLVVGDSLTGIGTIHEATDELVSDDAQASLFDDPVREALAAAEEPLRRLANIADATPADIRDARDASEAARAAVRPVEDLFDLAVAARIGEASPPLLTSIDQLETLEVGHARTVADELKVLHFPIAFPEVFLRERAGFDVILGNPPWEKVKVETHEFWGRHFPGFRALPQREKEQQAERFRQQRPDLVGTLQQERETADRLKAIIGSGPYDLGSGDTELARVFTWRFWHLIRDGGRFGVVLPRAAVLSSPGMESWRQRVLEGGAFSNVCLLTNNREWIFNAVHPQYTIGLVTVTKGDTERQVRLEGPHASLDSYVAAREREPARVSAEEFASWSDTAAFPTLNDPDDIPLYQRFLRHPLFGNEDRPDWYFRPLTETHATGDKELFAFAEDQPDGYWPVYSGSSFNLWEPETGEIYAWVHPDEITEHLYAKRLRQANHSRSAFYDVPEDLIDDRSTLPCLHPRIAFRDVARATDQRTMIAALIPPRVVPQHKAPYLLRLRGDESDEAYLLGVISTRVFDWFIRHKVEVTVSFTILNSLPVPAPDRSHPGRRRVVEIAGRLAAVDQRYEGWADAVGVGVGDVKGEEHLVAELEAAVARLYGLTPDDLFHLYSTFHPTWDHEPFMRAVLDCYDAFDFEPAEVPT